MVTGDGRIWHMGNIGKIGRYLGSLIGRTPQATQEIAPDHYELTYAGCADFLLERLHSKEPPFDPNEWHLAAIKIPSEEREATFELISWMNSFALFVMLVLDQHGEESGLKLARELNEQLLSVLPDSGPALARFLGAILSAPPLPYDHPVFARNEWCQKWSTHTKEFGRAKAALDCVTEIDREEALSLLGPCMVYGTHCSLTRFSGLVPKIRFIENPQAQIRANEAIDISENPDS
jgi:hypothetical protein